VIDGRLFVNCSSSWLAHNTAYSEADPAKLDDIIELSFIAKLAKLTQRLPNFGLRRVKGLLIELVGVVDPIAVVGQVNERYPWVVVEVLVVLVNYTGKVVKALELNLVLKPVYFHYR
jgi:hypothetical protein